VKKLLLVVAVAALALTLVPLAVAGAPGGGGWKHAKGKAKFNLVGTVVAVDAADAVTIKVKAGTKTIRSLRRTEAPFTLAANAKVWLLTEDGAVAKTLADVAPGDKVKARGVIVKTKDAVTGEVAVSYVIKCLKYRDMTPDEVAPPAAE
jgi:hypothetical protein